jgi:predicted nucleotidyltransferase
MRLTHAQIRRLKDTVQQCFGADARVWLFGSRVDDARRGGDYDVYVETSLADAAVIVDRKLDALVALKASPEFEDEKIDLVVRPVNASIELPIYQVARQSGVQL